MPYSQQQTTLPHECPPRFRTAYVKGKRLIRRLRSSWGYSVFRPHTLANRRKDDVPFVAPCNLIPLSEKLPQRIRAHSLSVHGNSDGEDAIRLAVCERGRVGPVFGDEQLSGVAKGGDRTSPSIVAIPIVS